MKNGFTLIELLAVIVILAIIALIATPIVLSIIKDSRESSGLRSAEMYLDAVEQAVSIEKMNNTSFNPNSCDITKEGNLYCEGYEYKIKVEVKGEKPINGNIIFEEGKITNIRLEYKNDKVIIKDEDGNLVYGEVGSGSGSEEEETLAPGLYKTDGTFVSWEQLTSLVYQSITYNDFNTGVEVTNAILTVTNGWVSANYDPGIEINYSSEYLDGVLVLDSSIKGLYFDVFNCCSQLTAIVIPDSVKMSEDMMFYGCENLSTIYYSGDTSSVSRWGVDNLTVKSYDDALVDFSEYVSD